MSCCNPKNEIKMALQAKIEDSISPSDFALNAGCSGSPKKLKPRLPKQTLPQPWCQLHLLLFPFQ